MEIAIYTLTTEEVKEQEQVITKYEGLLQKEIRMGDLMSIKKVESYAKTIKNAQSLIKNGITYDNEFMVNQLRNNTNAKILTV